MNNSAPAYNPTPEEVKIRVKLTDIMREFVWNSVVIDEIMHNDNPTVETVLKLIQDRGSIKAHNILKRFIK